MTHTQAQATLLATQGDRTAWEYGGEVYICATEPLFSGSPWPVNSRWECSIEHWRHYFSTCREQYGWTAAEKQGGGR